LKQLNNTTLHYGNFNNFKNFNRTVTKMIWDTMPELRRKVEKVKANNIGEKEDKRRPN